MLFLLSMIFGCLAKRRRLRILQAASEGVLSSREIALRARVSEFRASETLRDLESKNLLVSGDLIPVGLRVYRLTSEGHRALASNEVI